MRLIACLLAGMFTCISAPHVSAQSCETVPTVGSLIRNQIHCDLVLGLGPEDHAFLISRLDQPYRIAANEVSEEASDARFYLGIAALKGLGMDRDPAAGVVYLDQVASQSQSFDAYDRPGTAFFRDLGFDLNVDVRMLQAVLLGTGPQATPATRALLDRHLRRVEMVGNHAVLISLIRSLNEPPNAAIRTQERVGFAQLSALAQRDPAAAELLASWDGKISVLALTDAAGKGDRTAIRALAEGVIDGSITPRTDNQSLQILNAVIDAEPGFPDALQRAVLQASTRIFERQARTGRFSVSHPMLYHVIELMDRGQPELGYDLYQWSSGQIDQFLPVAAEAGHIDAQLILAKTAEESGTSRDLLNAIHWYEAAALLGHPASAAKVGALEAELIRRDEETRRLEQMAEQGRAQLARLRDNPDAIRTEIWKLTTDTVTRPICRQAASRPVMQLTRREISVQMKGDVCEIWSILAGSIRFMVRTVDPTGCDETGCEAVVDVGCVTKGAPMLGACTDFYADGPVRPTVRLEPDAQSRTGFRLLIKS